MIPRYASMEISDIWSKHKKYALWLKIEQTYAKQLFERGRIPSKAHNKIQGLSMDRNGLCMAYLDKIDLIEKSVQHDVQAFLEYCYKQLGKDSIYFHNGLTSSDIVDTANCLRFRQSLWIVKEKLARIIGRRKLVKDVKCIGRTHGQWAEEMSLNHRFDVWYTSLGRCYKILVDVSPLVNVGKLSGPVGTGVSGAEISALASLGLIKDISFQAINRDRFAVIIQNLAILCSVIEKIALDIRNLQRSEIDEFREPFGMHQKGSSAMPHKRNPIRCEKICGLTRLMRGYASVAMENIALWEERDLTHSSNERIIFEDSFQIAFHILLTIEEILENLEIDYKNIQKNLNMAKKKACSHSEYLMKAKTKGKLAAYKETQKKYQGKKAKPK